MTVSLPDEYLTAHYPNVWERMADRWVHIVALSAFGAGSAGQANPGLVMAERAGFRISRSAEHH